MKIIDSIGRLNVIDKLYRCFVITAPWFPSCRRLHQACISIEEIGVKKVVIGINILRMSNSIYENGIRTEANGSWENFLPSNLG